MLRLPQPVDQNGPVVGDGKRPVSSDPRERVASVIALIAPVAVVLTATTIACGSAKHSHVFIPGSKIVFPDWMAGPLARLGPQLSTHAFGPLMLVMFAGYLATVALASRVSTRRLIVTVIVADLIMTLAPPLMSADVFGYVGYARLEVVHSINPYLHPIITAPHDSIVFYSRWHHEVTPYGPLFTAFSYALVPLGIAANLWAFKALAGVFGLVLAALVWRLAKKNDSDPNRALAFVMLNPLMLIFAIGGAHNDLLMLAVTLAGFIFVAGDRPALAGSAMVTAVAIKATACLYLPFALIGSVRKKTFVGAALATTALVGVLSLIAFKGAAGAIAGQILMQQKLVATGSVPKQLSILLGFDDIPFLIRGTALALLAATFIGWMVRARSTGEWLVGSGWTALTLVATTAWLTPWYILCALPIAAVSRSKRLIVATAVMTLYLISTYTVLPFLMHEYA